MNDKPNNFVLKFGTDDPRIKDTGCQLLYIEIRNHLVSYGHFNYIKSPNYWRGNPNYWNSCKGYVDQFIEIAHEHRRDNIEIDRIGYRYGCNDPEVTKYKKSFANDDL